MPSAVQISINKRIDSLTDLISTKEDAVKAAPSGKVHLHSSRGYTQITSEGEGEIRSLIQRDYDLLVIKAARDELDYLQKIRKRFPAPAIEDIYDKLPAARRQYINPVSISDDEFVTRWMCEKYEQKPNATDFVTKKGDCVRSKSELIIADRLYDRGIPYRYEAKLELGKEVIYPDFTILDIKKRRKVYLEHMGKLGDPTYVGRNIKRINTYIKNGISLNGGLILTLESDDTPLDTVALDAVIKGFTPMSDELKAKFYPASEE